MVLWCLDDNDNDDDAADEYSDWRLHIVNHFVVCVRIRVSLIQINISVKTQNSCLSQFLSTTWTQLAISLDCRSNYTA